MAIKTKEELKALFETGDKPSQQDFQDLLESLVGKGEPVASNAWQPPNSPVYLGTDQELTCTHPEIVNENYSISISQEIAGVAGQTNISINFDAASEASYSQSDALYGTDFIDGKVLLHKTLGNSVDLSRSASTINPFTISASDCSYSYGSTPLDPFRDGSSVPGDEHCWDSIRTTAQHWLRWDFNRPSKLTSCRVRRGSSTEAITYFYFQGSNDGTNWVTLGSLTPAQCTAWSDNTIIVASPDYYSKYRINTYCGYIQIYQLNFFEIEETYAQTLQTVTTTDNSHFSMQQAEKIQSLVITNTQPINTNIKTLVSFDGRETWNYFNGVEWLPTTLAITNANTITELQSGFVNLSCEGKVFLDFAFFLSSTDIHSTPSIDLVTIVYQDNSSYAPAIVSTDFSVKRVNPTTTIIKRLNTIPGKAFITITIN